MLRISSPDWDAGVAEADEASYIEETPVPKTCCIHISHKIGERSISLNSCSHSTGQHYLTSIWMSQVESDMVVSFLHRPSQNQLDDLVDGDILLLLLFVHCSFIEL
jgi:hypothetical protein